MSTGLADASTLDQISDDVLAQVRAAFESAGFHEQLIAQIEKTAARQLDRVRFPVIRWRLRHNDGPATRLARL